MAARVLELTGGTVTVTGFAKGAAMIGPNLATMLGFVLTDAAVGEHDLHSILKAACDAIRAELISAGLSEFAVTHSQIVIPLLPHRPA